MSTKQEVSKDKVPKQEVSKDKVPTAYPGVTMLVVRGSKEEGRWLEQA